MKNETNWEELSQEVSRDRRKEVRVALSFPIEVSGFDHDGHFFMERSLTADVSESGCRFRLKREIEPSVVVGIKVVNQRPEDRSPDRPLLYQVARVVREPDGWTIGAVKLQPESIWRVAFPSPNETQNRLV